MESRIRLGFNEEEHKYYNKDTDEVFISVTTLIDKYDKKFNKHFWAMYTALKNANIKVIPKEKSNIIVVRNVPHSINELYNNPLYYDLAQTTKEKWERDTVKSHVRGNKIHDYLEDSINKSRGDEEGKDNEEIKPLRNLSSSYVDDEGKVVLKIKTKNDLDKTDLKETYIDIYNCLLDYIDRGFTLFAEKKIYSTQFGIAGMIDVIAVKGNQFAIIDWKSNKDEMKFIAGYYKKVKQGNLWVKGNEFIRTKDTLLYPLDTVAKCKGMKYSLQLSLYARIMELWGYTLIENGLHIFHIRPNRKPLKLKIKYMKEEIDKTLNHHKDSKRIQENPITPNEAFNKPKPKRKFGITSL